MDDQGLQRSSNAMHAINIQMKGYTFTWERGRGKPQFVEEKLDRALASTSWKERFPDASVLTTQKKISRIAFRFENRWMEDKGFGKLVNDQWEITNSSATITERLRSLSTELTRWSRKHPKIDRKNIEELKDRLERMRSNTDQQSAVKAEEMKMELNQMMIKNDMYWK
ncbi:uncharacterized protein [Primulina eburnea]|uniref:uncharacterized protein n=1 Tax=Primulina eburnea TaxID=1245227 RepID=UPI003C6C5690